MKTELRILKANQVDMSGTYSLAKGMPTRPVSADSPQVQGTPQARIVEQHAEYAVLEITCGCGHAMQVKCDYSPALATS